MKKQNGITLIALVITIIVLLILAGVSISLVIGDNGILTQATQAVKDNREAKAREDLAMLLTEAESAYLKAWTKDSSLNRSTFIKNYLKQKLGDAAINETVSDGIDVTITTDGEPYTFNVDDKGKITKANSNGSTENEGNTGNTGSSELNPTGIIPEGATLEVWDEDTMNRKTYKAGEAFPEPQLLIEAEYIYGDYSYWYGTELFENEVNGWSVHTIDQYKDTYGFVLESIAGIPIVSMSNCFAGCTSLESLPEGFRIPDTVVRIDTLFGGCIMESLPSSFRIPENVENMCGAFDGCWKLKTLPEGFTIPNGVKDISALFISCTGLEKLPSSFVIPESVVYMSDTFNQCTSLTGNIKVNANPDNVDNCFYGVNPENINIVGTCSQETKEALLETAVVY